jgi:hypothetical protein
MLTFSFHFFVSRKNEWLSFTPSNVRLSLANHRLLRDGDVMW